VSSVVTAEKTGDGSGRHDCHMLHMYPLDGRAAVKPAGLTLSSNCVALCVCPVTGRVLVLLANGILIVVNPRADDFELVLEAVWSLVFSPSATFGSGSVTPDSVLVVSPSGNPRSCNHTRCAF
jgi:hypothetical protein